MMRGKKRAGSQAGLQNESVEETVLAIIPMAVAIFPNLSSGNGHVFLQVIQILDQSKEKKILSDPRSEKRTIG